MDSLNEEDFLTVVQFLGLHVIADDRWSEYCDDLCMEVFGLILYGYALEYSDVFSFSAKQAKSAVFYVLTEHAQCTPELATSILREAEKSALDPAYNRSHHDLIEVGSSYTFSEDMRGEADNVYQNMESYRRAKEAKSKQ